MAMSADLVIARSARLRTAVDSPSAFSSRAVSSSALVTSTATSQSWREMSRLAASEFRQMSHLASSDPYDSRTACLANPEDLAHWLDRLIAELQKYRDRIAEISLSSRWGSLSGWP